MDVITKDRQVRNGKSHKTGGKSIIGEDNVVADISQQI